MEDSQFVMLGAIHGDTEGREILAGLLTELRPDVITLEFSRYGLDFRQINGDRLRKRLNETIREMGLETGDDQCQGPLRSVLSYLNLPYEFTTVSDYSLQNSVPFHLVDTDFFSQLKLREIYKVLDKGNLEVLSRLPGNSVAGVAREKALAELFFKSGLKDCGYTDEMHIRDNLMKDRILLLMKHHGPGRFVHLCGWRHLSDPRDVFGPLRPVKVFMYDRTFRI
jgi:hypothetical protein